MQSLAEMEIGVVFWADHEPEGTLRELKESGVRCGQMGVWGHLELDRELDRWKPALAAEQFALTALFCGYSGESYQDYPTIERTVGFLPKETRSERLARTLAVSDYAAQLSVPGIALHAGFIPEHAGTPDYSSIRDIIRQICDHAARQGQTLALETGQERSDVLLRFISDCSRENLKVNFDPANMILYGAQEPIPALRELAPVVVSVHCKDGKWPSAPRTLGTEMPLGQGDVGLPKFLSALREIGYRGQLHIEREAPNPIERMRDIRNAVSLLRQLLA